MATATATPEATPPKSRARWPLLLGLILALCGAGSGFFITFSGILPRGAPEGSPPEVAALPDIAFVPLEPIMISLGPGSRSRHLRFAAHIEVEAKHRDEVETLKPRILDMLNGYLRALEPRELEQNVSLVRLRAQMLRRLQIITGEGRVRDLLITEFVLN